MYVVLSSEHPRKVHDVWALRLLKAVCYSAREVPFYLLPLLENGMKKSCKLFIKFDTSNITNPNPCCNAEC